MEWNVVRYVYDHEELVLEEKFEFNGTPEEFFEKYRFGSPLFLQMNHEFCESRKVSGDSFEMSFEDFFDETKSVYRASRRA